MDGCVLLHDSFLSNHIDEAIIRHFSHLKFSSAPSRSQTVTKKKTVTKDDQSIRSISCCLFFFVVFFLDKGDHFHGST